MKLFASLLAMVLSLTFANTAHAVSASFCAYMADIGGAASVLRQSGMSQRMAARSLANIIGSRLSNLPEFSIHDRQLLADMSGEWGTKILQIAYSYPIEPTEYGRQMVTEVVKEASWQGCMRGMRF